MSQASDFVILPAETRHVSGMMGVMHAAFDAEFGEAWSMLQLAGSMTMPSSFARLAATGDSIRGFSLSRAAGPEVELLLIAVAPLHRGAGMGRTLLEHAISESFQRGASEIFLEVRENNLAARALYARCGFVDVGRRDNYYTGTTGARFGAITMRRSLDNLTG
ncbi:GNAT family N-acetyltransferase [Sandarakinorhabdus sp.]|uniref:GNAT family N-acetyltransferase n=1 Tax=Sandarakinorhabdus sp. TaxID=1916663 RepID=UPI00286DC19C|nr:GNAT family N-acetyltransferase [Sandarakinorhabdus sp.]